ncbi:MAG: hypothetical protein ACRCZE_00085 [Candidatus Altimarinota bacterium]
MGGLDLLKIGSSLLGGGEKPQLGPQQPSQGGGMMDKLKGLIGGGKNPEALNSANEIQNEAQAERRGFFGEFLNSFLVRQFPNASKVLDIGTAVGGATGMIDRKEEIYPLQHEFETITALTIFVPDSWLSTVTDPLAESEIFQTIVEYWPMASGVDLPFIGNEPLEDRVKAKDPDAVVEAIRVIHQDLMTGKVSWDAISGFLS